MNITVLFTNQKYRQYLTVYNFICDLKKHKWGELDIHEILWEDNSYDLRHFLYMVTSDKIKTDFFAPFGRDNIQECKHFTKETADGSRKQNQYVKRHSPRYFRGRGIYVLHL